MPDMIPPTLSTSAKRASAASIVTAETRLPGLCAAIVASRLKKPCCRSRSTVCRCPALSV